MRVLLESCFDHPSARRLYGAVALGLRLRGVEVDVVRCRRDEALAGYDFLVSHDLVDERTRGLPRRGCWGGLALSRPEGLEFLAAHGIAVMPWTRALDRAQVLELFDRWGAERLFLKRSGTRKGKGVWMFDRGHIAQVEWDPTADVFCPELDRGDGTVYKAEMFNGRILLEWRCLRRAPAEEFGGFASASGWLSAPRERFRLPADLRDALRRLSAALTARGVGYTSIDLMRRPDGALVAIEVNTAQVATWWSARYPQTLWRYAAAVAALVR